MKLCKTFTLLLLGLTLCHTPAYTHPVQATSLTQVKTSQATRVGDAGVRFDTSKFDPNYPQMKTWSEAGVRGGIPNVNALKVDKTLYSGAKSKDIINAIKSLGNKGGVILLKNGTYDIDQCITIPSNIIIKGESRDKVVCVINKKVTSGQGAFNFVRSTRNSGLYNFTIKGGWGTPKHNWIVSEEANYELPGNDNISVFFNGCEDSWVDAVTILNSADFPMRCHGNHNTFRDLYVDGCFNKNGGCHGYFFLMGGHNLVTGSFITHIRHISIQGSNSKYNVVYDNDFAQEISFHSGDGGNNLIENNRITLPSDMPNSKPNMVAIMGPWSSQHRISDKPNFIYKNQCLEKNHNNNRPWSDSSVIYTGPFEVKPKNLYTNFRPLSKDKTPKGGTLYPIILNKTDDNTSNKPSTPPSKPSTPPSNPSTPPSNPAPTIYFEDFRNLTINGWTRSTFRGNNNILWRIDAKAGSNYINNSKAIYMAANKVGLSTSSITKGVNSFTVICKPMFQLHIPRTLQLIINDKVVATRTFTGNKPYTFKVENIKVKGNVKLELKNVSKLESSGNTSIAIDDVKWTPYTP